MVEGGVHVVKPSRSEQGWDTGYKYAGGWLPQTLTCTCFFLLAWYSSNHAPTPAVISWVKLPRNA